MGAEIVIGAIGLAIAGASATTQYINQEEQKKARRRQASVQKKQLDDQAEVERRKRAREFAQVRGRLRVSAAEAGLDQDSYSALFGQASLDEAETYDILDRNLTSQRQLVDSGLQANLSALDFGALHGVLQTFQGGLSGYQTGLQIESYQDARRQTAPNTNTGTS